MKFARVGLPSIFLALMAHSALAQTLAPRLVSSNGGNEAIQLQDVIAVDDYSRPISAPWPFTSNRVHVFCAASGVTVVQAGYAFAALNGYTSSIARQMHIKEQSGQERNIIGTSDNRLLKAGGAVNYDARDPDIGEWFGFLRGKALKVCGL